MTIAFVGSNTVSTTSGNVSLAKPAGAAQGHLAIAVLGYWTAAGPVTPPTGWTLLDSGANGGNGAAVYYKVLGASEPASWTWTFGGTLDQQAGAVAVYSGVNTTQPVQAWSENTASSSSNLTAASVTITAAPAQVVFLAGSNASTAASSTVSPPSGWTERAEVHNANYGGAYIADAPAAATGATGSILAPASAAAAWVVYAVVLSEAAGGGTTITLSDSGVGSDSVGPVLVTCAIADVGAAFDGFGVAASSAVADNGQGVDSTALSVRVTLADIGAGTDTLLARVLLALADSGAGVDSLSGVMASFALIDSGAGSEALAVTVAAGVADGGSGADALALLAETLKQIFDSGLGVDLVLPPAVTLTITDSGAGVDAGSVAVTLSLADDGSGADLLLLTRETLKAIFDAGAGTDTVSATPSPVLIAESGMGSDSVGVHVALALPDSGTGVDGVLASVLLSIAEMAEGVDAVGSISVNVQVADLGHALDVLGQVRAALALADVGSGVDAVVRFDSLARIVAVTFALRQRRMVFGWTARSVVWVWSKRDVEFLLSGGGR